MGHDGAHVDPKKIQPMKDSPCPKILKNFRGFWGLIGYYRKFIHNYGKIVGDPDLCEDTQIQ